MTYSVLVNCQICGGSGGLYDFSNGKEKDLPCKSCEGKGHYFMTRKIPEETNGILDMLADKLSDGTLSEADHICRDGNYIFYSCDACVRLLNTRQHGND